MFRKKKAKSKSKSQKSNLKFSIPPILPEQIQKPNIKYTKPSGYKKPSKQQQDEAMKQLLAAHREWVENNELPEGKSSLIEIYLERFTHEECSWCKLFYTSPCECKYDRKRFKRCDYYDDHEFTDEQRHALLEDQFWKIIITEWMSLKYSSAIKCKVCGAMNADPSITHIWECTVCGNKL